MREILFRGKRKDNGEWMYGYLVIADERYFIATYPECITSLYYPDDIYTFTSFVEVIPSTVGQYIGLTDKNGKKIFEGDIVKGKDNLERNLAVGGYIDHENGSFVIVGEFMTHYRWLDYELEVIGNRYDDPELLEGGVDNG